MVSPDLHMMFLCTCTFLKRNIEQIFVIFYSILKHIFPVYFLIDSLFSITRTLLATF
jgi:hypothetical protein